MITKTNNIFNISSLTGFEDFFVITFYKYFTPNGVEICIEKKFCKFIKSRRDEIFIA